MRALLVCAVIGAGAACTNAPDGARSPVAPCVVTSTLSANSYGPGATTATATITTSRGCGWSIQSEAWVALSAKTGEGPATVSLSVAENQEGAERSGTIVIAEQRHAIIQSGCSASLATGAEDFDDRGGTRTVQVNSAASCRWTAASLADWIRVEPPAGAGSGTLSITVSENNHDQARTGGILVNGAGTTIRQGVEPCRYAASIEPARLGQAGGSALLRVASGAACPWRATTSATWLRIGNPAGTGSLTVALAAEANTGTAARIAQIEVENQILELAQAGTDACAYRVSPVEFVAMPLGESSDFTIDTSPGCAWTADAQVQWVRLSAESGAGPSRIHFDVAPSPVESYPTSTHPTTVQVRWPGPTAGQNIQITRLPICHMAFSSGFELRVNPAGGRQNVIAYTDSAFTCPWSAKSDVPWIEVIWPPYPRIHRGDTNLIFTVEPNDTGRERRGRIMAAERFLTVIQSPR